MHENPGTLIAHNIGFGPRRSSFGSGWHNVTMYEWNGTIEDSNLGFQSEPLLALHLSGDNLEVKVDGRWTKKQSYPGSLTLVPPSASRTYQLKGKINSLTAHLNASCFATGDGELFEGALYDLQFQCAFKDDFLSAAIRGLSDEMESPCQIGPLYADSVATSLAMHVLRKYIRSPHNPTGQLMSRRTLRIALELLENSIETGISLDHLASKVGLSRGYFSRAFKNSTGIPPHGYLTAKRLGRARELLANSDEMIARIAIRCGFSSQAHFSEAFRRATGLTPANYRRVKKA